MFSYPQYARIILPFDNCPFNLSMLVPSCSIIFLSTVLSSLCLKLSSLLQNLLHLTHWHVLHRHRSSLPQNSCSNKRIVRELTPQFTPVYFRFGGVCRRRIESVAYPTYASKQRSLSNLGKRDFSRFEQMTWEGNWPHHSSCLVPSSHQSSDIVEGFSW